ncbi:MAG: hypothetical protein O2800_02505 [Planctomycetota bacterium]|nr:hypothetical protein [Planctomycetota bacterium]
MIRTTLQPRFKWWTLGYTILCLVFGVWGGYDYWVGIPKREADFAQYIGLTVAKDLLETRAQQRVLTETEVDAYEAAKAQLASYAEPPDPVAGWDRQLQLWAYVIGCGVMGFPWFAWTLYSTSRSTWTLHDDGSLETPTGTIAASDMTDIDMSRWMSKSLVKVLSVNEGSTELDDYKYRGVAAIVVELTDRFHPGQWTKEARPVKENDEDPIDDTVSSISSDSNNESRA